MRSLKKFLIGDLTDKIEKKTPVSTTFKSGSTPKIQDANFKLFLLEEIKKDEERKKRN